MRIALGAAIVAIVKSRSAMAGRTPSGSLIMLIWTPSPMSSPARSTSIECGILSGEQITSTSWRTMFSTPPRLIPGEAS